MLSKAKVRKTAKPGATTSKSKPSAKTGTKRSQSAADFAPVFSALKKVMAAYARQLHVVHDEPKKYYLVTKSKSWRGGPMFFGAVISGKAYVSYHLMPLYFNPQLAQQISPELKRRMQGKTCFNFRSLDAPLMSQLSDLTKAGLEHYREKKLL
jgi:hypothetical protein